MSPPQFGSNSTSKCIASAFQPDPGAAAVAMESIGEDGHCSQQRLHRVERDRAKLAQHDAQRPEVGEDQQFQRSQPPFLAQAQRRCEDTGEEAQQECQCGNHPEQITSRDRAGPPI